MTQNKTVLKWLDEMKALLTPDEVVWIDGSEAQLDALRKEAVESGEMIKLNEEKLPGCYLHRTTMLPELKTAPSSARQSKRTQARQTTGAHPMRCIRNFMISPVAHTRAEPCISSPSQWDR